MAADSATYKKDVGEKFLDLKIKFANDALLDAGEVLIAQDWKLIDDN